MKQSFKGEYAEDWPDIALKIKQRADWCCERCGHPHDFITHHILTVHHLDGDKSNNKWWNTAALCQRCHLSVQGRVIMHRQLFLPHTPWMRCHAAGFYAHLLELPDDEQYVRANEQALLDLGQGYISMEQYTNIVNKGIDNE